MSYSSHLPWKHSLNLCPLKCQESLGHVTFWDGWLSLDQPCHSCLGWKQLCSWEDAVWAEPSVSVLQGEWRRWPPGNGDHSFPNIHIWTFWATSNSKSSYFEVGRTFYRFTRYPPGVCWETPLSPLCCLPFPLCEGWGGLCYLICPYGYFFFFFFLGENSGMLLLSDHRAEWQEHAKEISSLFANSAIHAMLMSIRPRGNLGNSGLCAPVASTHLASQTTLASVPFDLAPPQASCPCRSFARLLEYCFFRLQDWKQRARNAYLIRSVWRF